MRAAMKAGGSRTAPDFQETVARATALAPAAQPRPAPPGRALPAARRRLRRLPGFQLVFRSRADPRKSQSRFRRRPRGMSVAPGLDLAIDPRSETRFCL